MRLDAVGRPKVEKSRFENWVSEMLSPHDGAGWRSNASRDRVAAC
jgi:hypothetical protein